MRMAFAQAGTGNAHEGRLFLEVLDVLATDVTHGGLQATGELVEDGRDWTLVGNLAFDAFRHELQRIAHFRLEVAIGRAAGHGTDGAHAAIGLEGAALVEIDLARAFVRASEQRADHDGGSAGGNRLGNVAGELQSTIGDDGDVELVGFLDGRHDGCQLGNANAGDNAGGADRARADADLDAVSACIDERAGAFASCHIAGDDADGIRHLLHMRDGIQNLLAVAMSGINDDDIAAGIDQALSALDTVITRGDGSGDAETALGVLGGMRVELRLLNVLDGDQTDAAAFVIDHQQLLDAVRMQQALGFLLVDTILDRHEVFAGHQFVDLLARVRRKAHVAVGQNTDKAARAACALDDRDAGNAMGTHQRLGFRKRCFRADGHRIDDHAAFELLHLANFFGLFDGGEVAVDDADATGLCHRDREAAFSDRVHSGGENRQREIDVPGDACRDVGLPRHHFRVPRLQEDVVKGERFCACCRHYDACHCQFLRLNRQNPPGKRGSPFGRFCMKCLEVGEGW